MAEGDDFERRLVLSVDVKGYGKGTARRQGIVQKDLINVLGDAAERAGLSRTEWQRQPGGDGELAVMPTGERETRVADDFIRHLVAALRRCNRDATPEQRLRLRLALHFGPTIRDVNGYSGSGPVVVGRLCDCRPLRAALDVSGADLAVVLSNQIFSDTIAQEHTSLEPSDFRRVRVRAKEYDDTAWILVPGHDVHALDLPADVEPAPEPGGADTDAPRGKSKDRDPSGSRVSNTTRVKGNRNTVINAGGDVRGIS